VSEAFAEIVRASVKFRAQMFVQSRHSKRDLLDDEDSSITKNHNRFPHLGQLGLTTMCPPPRSLHLAVTRRQLRACWRQLVWPILSTYR